MYLDALVGAAGEQSVSLVDGDRQHDDDGMTTTAHSQTVPSMRYE